MSVNRDYEELDIGFAQKVLAVVNQANRESRKKDGTPKFSDFVKWSMFEGYRSQKRQDALYAQGRTVPGAKVTWVKESPHTARRAADVVWTDSAGNWRWDGPDDLWAILGHCARANGLRWGGDWKARDLPHIEAKPK